MAGVKLYDYQLDAVNRMKNGCILCGCVGSGKSRTGLAYYYIKNGGQVNTKRYVKMHDPPQDLYIITTARKRDTLEWEEEMIPFMMTTDESVRMYKHIPRITCPRCGTFLVDHDGRIYDGVLFRVSPSGEEVSLRCSCCERNVCVSKTSIFDERLEVKSDE